MESRLSKMTFLFLLFAALVVVAVSAYDADTYASVDKIGILVNDPNFDIPTGTENATVTGDDVRVREVPSIWGGAMEYPQEGNPVGLRKGTRIDVYARTDSTDTINGRTAPWYQTKYEMWIFGGFVKLDQGVEVPSVSLPSGNSDLMARFFEEGLHSFGSTKSEIVKRLGQPNSVTESKGYNKGDFFSEMAYDGLRILTYTADNGITICELTCTSDAYDFGGVKVGYSVTDLDRVFGNQEHELSRHTDGSEYYIYWIQSRVYVSFKIERERVIEITFGPGCID